MSHFTVAINDVLDRMKNEASTTRQDFGFRIGMSSGTLSSYTTGRTKPDASALAKLATGLSEADARRVIHAHLLDETPEAWRAAIRMEGETPRPTKITLAGYDHLPPPFRRDVELLLAEAERNDHIIAFVEEFVTLLGLHIEVAWPVPQKKFPLHPTPVGAAHSTSRHGDSTDTLHLNEDSPADAGASTLPSRPTGPVRYGAPKKSGRKSKSS